MGAGNTGGFGGGDTPIYDQPWGNDGGQGGQQQ